jgi:hypothetical protein
MVGRASPFLSTALLAAVLAACSRRQPLAAGSLLPLGSSGAQEGSRLVWVIPAEQLRVCGTAAGDLRRVQRASGLPLAVVFVGGKQDWLRPYLVRERLSATIVHLAPGEFRRRLNADPRSAVYVVRGDRVRAVVPVTMQPIEGAVRRAVAEQVAPVSEGS